MSKWISSAYIKLLMELNQLLQGNSEYELWKQTVGKVIDAMPSIEIVRCKDCKWYEQPSHKIYENCVRWKNTNGILLPIKPDDFCSYGERREP